MSILGDRIKKERENLNLTREDLAKKLGVSYSAIAMYEQGNREPNNELALKICEIFNCTLDYLMGKSNYKSVWEEYDATHDIQKIVQDVEKLEADKDEEEFHFAYHKEMEGLTDEEIADALRFYKEMKKRVEKDNK